MLSQALLDQAYQNIQQYLAPTPIIRSEYLSKKFEGNVFLKLDMLQPTNSFKVRGALNKALSFRPEQRSKGFLAVSGGNHGLGVAWAAQKLGVSARVFLPSFSSQGKINKLQDWGADVIVHGDTLEAAFAEATRQNEDEGRAFIHPFDDEYVVAGQSTVFRETIEEIEQVDTFVASVGGGGLLAGVIRAGAVYSPQTQFFGVETKGADSMAASLEAKGVVQIPAMTSIAESLGARKVAQMNYDIVSQKAKDHVVVEDSEALDAMWEIMEQEKIIVEPASSCVLAAVNRQKISLAPGSTTVLLMCGGNVTLEQIMSWHVEAKK